MVFRSAENIGDGIRSNAAKLQGQPEVTVLAQHYECYDSREEAIRLIRVMFMCILIVFYGTPMPVRANDLPEIFALPDG